MGHVSFLGSELVFMSYDKPGFYYSGKREQGKGEDIYTHTHTNGVLGASISLQRSKYP